VNLAERNMLDLLKRGKERFGFTAIKAEFEAEGTRPDELLRLLEITHRANLDVALKIGGCEALSDLQQARNYGVNHIIAPMVETPYALSKFVEAKDKAYGDNEQQTKFLFNVETITTLGNLDAMVAVAKSGGIHGIVFGRVDFTLSTGMARTAINDPKISECVLKVAEACAANDLELVVGGSVSSDAVEALRSFRDVRLDRFETRKVVFTGSAAAANWIDDAIATAVEFELTWLRNKRDYYGRIASEDAARIAMMEKRQAAALAS
jgi:acetylornithine deacetylase/succinyl-diaminopimelate desuccinylase-like protein